MGKLSKYLYGIMAAAMLAGCSDDGISPDDPGTLGPDDGSGFFMALDIQMPGGTNGSRSETIDPDDPDVGDGTNSSGGIEIGFDDENAVTSALIVLAATQGQGNFDQYGYIATGTVMNNRIADLNATGSKQYRATARLQKANLDAFYATFGTNEEGHKVYVFVFCNPTTELTAMFEGMEVGSTDWLNKTCSVIQGNPNGEPNTNIGIWGSNSFLMNNVSIATRRLPGKLLDWENYNSADKPFHLSEPNKDNVDNSAIANTPLTGGPVKVERSVARFDFRDGSKKEDGTPNDNTYDVLYFGASGAEQPIVEVQLQKMCLVNMSNSFYYVPRVSNNGTMPDNFLNPGEDSGFAFCSPELPWVRSTTTGLYTGGNYVVGPYYNVFNKALTANYYNYFNFPFFEETDDELVSFDNGNWDVVKISDVLNGRPDQYEGVDNPKPGSTTPYTPGTYKVWRYVTENVIPGGPENQRNSVSTGVVFKARIKGTEEALNSNFSNVEEAWNEGFVKNMANCLNGGTFTYEGTENLQLTGITAKDPILYYYDGRLYMGWRHIRQAAIQASVTINTSNAIEINRSNSLYKAVFGDGPIPPTYKAGHVDANGAVSTKDVNTVYMTPDNKPVDVVDPDWPLDDNGAIITTSAAYQNYLKSADFAWQTWFDNGKPEEGDKNSALLVAMRKAIVDSGITIYQSSVDDGVPGYYCYYYYWNRHNDNGLPGVMAPMEFAVVRNNVYKLSVDAITRLGHPRIPDNDPDNPTPDTPDESDKIYLDVQVQIIPWAVRLNSIVF